MGNPGFMSHYRRFRHPVKPIEVLLSPIGYRLGTSQSRSIHQKGQVCARFSRRKLDGYFKGDGCVLGDAADTQSQ